HAWRLESDYLARLIAWGLAPGASEEGMLDEARYAEARMQDYLDRNGLHAAQAPVRIRLDRLVLLHHLGRHAQVRDEARALQADGVELADYVLAPVGNSLMAEHHPDEAIPVLEAALRADPSNSGIRAE